MKEQTFEAIQPKLQLRTRHSSRLVNGDGRNGSVSVNFSSISGKADKLSSGAQQNGL